MQNAIAIAAFVALATLAGAAGAQGYRMPDDEDEYRGRNQDLRDAYRRGYDRGYRKGMEAAERRGPPVAVPPPHVPTGPIQVTGAHYGSDSRNCQALRQVARLANGKRSYSFKVTNEICGDPHPGQRKTLEVKYTCGHLLKTASAREHQTIYLDCSA